MESHYLKTFNGSCFTVNLHIVLTIISFLKKKIYLFEQQRNNEGKEETAGTIPSSGSLFEYNSQG